MLNVSAPTPAPAHITLRPYQLTCVERAIDAFQLRPKGGRALIVLPTGGGKTLVFAEIARRLGLSTLIIAHRQELLQQAAEKFLLIDPTASIGQVGAGKHEWGTPITVASVQTISRRNHLAKLRQFTYDLVIIDECHHSPASGYQTVLNALPDAFVLGVTATADRLDKMSVERIFGAPIFTTSIIDLIQQGYLSNIRAIAIPTTTSLDDLHTQAGDFKLDELALAVDTPERNAGIANSYLKHCYGRQGLCFAVTIAHAAHLAQAFQSAGVRAAVVCGETP
jgi:superfamily II DNA or RNA helicase